MLERTLSGSTGAEISVAGVRTRDRVKVAGSTAPTGVAWEYVPPRSLDACEVRRRVLHMLPGLFPFLLWFIPHPKPWGPILSNAVLIVMAIVVTTSLLRFSAFARPGESDGRSSILGYVFPVLLALCLFRGREELGMMTLAILAFGDGSATLGGMTMGGLRLPWNHRKTLTGLLCFLGVGGPLASLVLWGESAAGTSLSAAFACGMSTVLVAAVAESVPARTNDNLRVGLTAVLIGAVFQVLLIG